MIAQVHARGFIYIKDDIAADDEDQDADALVLST
jgi:hypothetical protein